jgi:hypothetical protein
MTNAVTVKRTTIESDAHVVYAQMDITSYTTGGETLTPASFGLDSINFDEVIPYSKENGYMFKIDVTNKKVMAYTAADTQVTAAVDVGIVGLRLVGNS